MAKNSSIRLFSAIFQKWDLQKIWSRNAHGYPFVQGENAIIHGIPTITLYSFEDCMSRCFAFFRTFIFFPSLLIVVNAQTVWAFSIIEPKESSTLQSGQNISVVIDYRNASGVTKVKYYWYGESEDMLQESLSQRLALASRSNNVPPFGGELPVPLEAIGTYRLLAVAEQGGRQSDVASLAIFDEILVQIEPDAELVEIDFQANKPLRLGRAGSARVYDQVDFVGKTIELPVIGRFSDDVTRSIRTQSAGTTYEVANEKVVTVNPDGILRIMGSGETVVTVKNRQLEAAIEILVEVDDQPNQPPVSDAGKHQSVYSGERVELNALGSYDPDGGSLQYHWSQVRGSKIPLLDPYSAQARFLAPFVVEERTFRFKLRVTDILGADSLPAYVDIVVKP